MRVPGVLVTLLVIPVILVLMAHAIPLLLGGVKSEENVDSVPLSRGYEKKVFDGVLTYEELLSSRYSDAPNEPCEHVFVRLTPDSSLAPPRSPAMRDRKFRFGGIWRRSPIASEDTATLEPVAHCVAFIGTTLANAVTDALRQDGAFYYRDLTDGTLHVYAPESRIAGRIRLAPARRY